MATNIIIFILIILVGFIALIGSIWGMIEIIRHDNEPNPIAEIFKGLLKFLK